MNHKLSRRLLARTITRKFIQEPQRHKHWVQVLAAYLVESNRVDELDLIVNDIAQELFTQRGELAVAVTSARPLTDQIRRELTALLKNATGARAVALHERHDPTLLGGLVARTPAAQLDVSLQTTLKQLATIR